MDRKKVFASFHIVLIYRYFELFQYLSKWLLCTAFFNTVYMATSYCRFSIPQSQRLRKQVSLSAKDLMQLIWEGSSLRSFNSQCWKFLPFEDFMGLFLRSCIVMQVTSDILRFTYLLGIDAWRPDAFEAYRRLVVCLGDLDFLIWIICSLLLLDVGWNPGGCWVKPRAQVGREVV